MSNKKIKIYCGWISTGQSETTHLYLKRDLEERYGDRVELVLPDQAVFRIFHDFARNAVVDEFLQSDCDILWFLDSDIVPPNHVLDLVVHHKDKWVVAGAPYPIYMTIPGTDEMGICFTVYNGILESGKRGLYMSECPEEGTAFVDGLATGCLFIKREAFDGLKKPYFEFKFNEEDRSISEGEDLGFVLKMHDKGVKFFVDYAMVCKHYKRTCLLEMHNHATKKSNAAIIKYDKEIRSSVSQAMQASYNKGFTDAKKQAEQASQVSPNRTKSGLILPNSVLARTS